MLRCWAREPPPPQKEVGETTGGAADQCRWGDFFLTLIVLLRPQSVKRVLLSIIARACGQAGADLDMTLSAVLFTLGHPTYLGRYL